MWNWFRLDLGSVWVSRRSLLLVETQLHLAKGVNSSVAKQLLRTYMRKKRMDSVDGCWKPRFSLAMSWALQTAGALEYLHGQERPIIHRDLFFSSILLDDFWGFNQSFRTYFFRGYNGMMFFGCFLITWKIPLKGTQLLKPLVFGWFFCDVFHCAKNRQDVKPLNLFLTRSLEAAALQLWAWGDELKDLYVLRSLILVKQIWCKKRHEKTCKNQQVLLFFFFKNRWQNMILGLGQCVFSLSKTHPDAGLCHGWPLRGEVRGPGLG